MFLSPLFVVAYIERKLVNRKDLIDRLQALYKDEDSRVTVNPHAGQKVAIVYPNTYFVGMSNLGLHIIYEEINLRHDSVCERIFLPEKKELEAYDKTKTPLMSVETQRPMHQFDVVAFDVTFEMDYFHIPLMLRHGRVPIMGGKTALNLILSSLPGGLVLPSIQSPLRILLMLSSLVKGGKASSVAF